MNKRIGQLMIAVLLLGMSCMPPAGAAVSSGTTIIMLYLDQKEAVVNENVVKLDSPATAIQGRTFVPLKFLADYMGFSITQDNRTGNIVISSPLAVIIADKKANTAFVNGEPMTYKSLFAIRNGRLMMQLKSVETYMGAKLSFEPSLKRVDIYYVKRPMGMDIGESSKPVAKFYFPQTSYRIGEPVKYMDLSYDPDGDGIAKHVWTGRQEAYFNPGTYDISLKVFDSKGNVSETYTRKLVIDDIPYLNKLEYPMYNAAIGSFLPFTKAEIEKNLKGLPLLYKEEELDQTRKLIVSDSPESITAKGVLYQETVNGKARLYANHINKMNEKVQFAILVTNNTDHDVTVKTTNKGEVYPSIHANLIGHVASMDFMLNDHVDEKLVVPPRQTFTYVQMPDFFPSSGVNAFYDVETDDQITFSFMAMDQFASPSQIVYYQPLGYNGHVRGTFPAAEKHWEIDAKSISQPTRLTIGDGISDQFLKGTDSVQMMDATNKGNYGVVYKIHADSPRKMAILLLARGGPFKGPIKINGEFIMVPKSGLLRAYQDVPIIARTTGKEGSLTIELTPPAGSAFPIDIIFYPLNDK